MFYAIGTDNGAVSHFVSGMTADEAQAQAQPGQIVVEYDGSPKPGGLIQAGAVVFPDPTLDERKAAKWQAALVYRNSRQEGGCATSLGTVDTDADSQRKIAGAVLAAVIAKNAGKSFSVDWTMADNSIAPHDADQMIAMGMAVTQFIQECQNAGTAIRSQIEAVTSSDQLDAIDSTAGYPAS